MVADTRSFRGLRRRRNIVLAFRWSAGRTKSCESVELQLRCGSWGCQATDWRRAWCVSKKGSWRKRRGQHMEEGLRKMI
eukprot:6209104-Pleurochrysis_carterae.AAC.2